MSDTQYSFSKKFVEGELSSGFWNLLMYAITTLNSALIIYYLSVYEYGAYQLILAIIATASSFTIGFFDNLVSVDLTRYLSRGELPFAKKLFREHAALKIILGIVVSLALIAGADLIAVHYGKDIGYLLRIIGFLVVLGVGQSVMRIFFDSNLYFRAMKNSFIGELAKLFILVFFFLTQGLGITQLLLAVAGGQLVSFIFSFSHFWKLYSAKFKGVIAAESGLIKALIKSQGVWLVFRYFLSKISANLRPWVIKFLVSTEAVGLFSFARNIISIVMRLMPLGTFGVLLPRELDNEQRLRYIFVRGVKYSLYLGLIVAPLLFFFFPVLVDLFLPKYSSAMPLLRIFAPILIFYSLYKIFRMTLLALKEHKSLLIRSLDESILTPIFLFILIPIFGIAGAALEWTITYGITTLFFYVYLARQHPHFKIKIRDLLIDKYDLGLLKRFWRRGADFINRRL